MFGIQSSSSSNNSSPYSTQNVLNEMRKTQSDLAQASEQTLPAADQCKANEEGINTLNIKIAFFKSKREEIQALYETRNPGIQSRENDIKDMIAGLNQFIAFMEEKKAELEQLVLQSKRLTPQGIA